MKSIHEPAHAWRPPGYDDDFAMLSHQSHDNSSQTNISQLGDDDYTSLIPTNLKEGSASGAKNEGSWYDDTRSTTVKRSNTQLSALSLRFRKQPEQSIRTIHINNPELNAQQKFLHNKVFMAKYSWYSFLPKFLGMEFSKTANLFFLFISCIQQIPDISPTSPWATIVPLVIVLLATGVKELIEDMAVHRSDAEVNARKVKILSSKDQFVEKQWKDLRVGDIVRLESGEFFPADLILLSSSEPQGLCYIETSSLDGEVNLKIKQALMQTADLTSPVQISQLRGVIKSELPNNRLYNYEGTLSIYQPETGQTKDFPLDPTQILLRGAQLRNTSWIYGIVVFTGHETKLMLNSQKKPVKQSNITRITNRNIIWLFILLVLMSVLASAGNVIIYLRNNEKLSYLGGQKENLWATFGFNILTFIILFNSFIPISLMVTMEIVKYWQSSLIDADLDMYYDQTHTSAVTRSSSLVEELGQIGYVFSDKTGTLTCNIMEFRECSIAGMCYAEKVNENRAGECHSFQTLRENLKSHPTANIIHEFLAIISTCHTVIPERGEGENNITYQASSPDDGALVKGASLLGYTFTTRRPNSVTVEVNGAAQEYQILNICEFNSTRKRLSVIVRGPDSKIKLYCKGADTVILERLCPDNPFVETTLTHLEEFATEGLRTLCIAMREIPEDEYSKWATIFEKASTTLTNRQEELDKAAELIERDMFLLGATAIEDKLQDGVPDTIHTLHEAGVKIWVLTGDRQETAINIGYSCKLLTDEMSLIVCNEETHSNVLSFLEKKYEEISTILKRGEEIEPLALVIDGKALTYALERDVEKTFLNLAVLCRAVICCRVSPLQKALVVKLVKKYVKSILLAIGDGANDVSMIQAAHVGVGISGVEGLQAARSADFAIAQFRYLKKLLLVHGAWSYHRMSKMIFFYFYKNVALYLTQFWYAIFNGFSGQTLYESWTLSCFNVLFTILPPVVIGVFDQYVNARMLDKYPQMYTLGHSNEFFNQKRFFGWLANAVFHSLILFFCGYLAFNDDLVLPGGYIGGHYIAGTIIFTSILMTLLLKGGLITDTWNKYAAFSIPGSLIVWFIFLPFFTWFGPIVRLSNEYDGVPGFIFTSPYFYLYIIVVPLLCILRDYVWKYVKRMYRPLSYHCVQEIQKYNIPDYRPRADRFRQAVSKVRRIQRLKRNRGFAFAQSETDQTKIIRAYDTTIAKPLG
ncbi:uncharacterized protein VTP21DRAFT_5943 [Calcarisporiella thermophila]|uniref:uncharacterized protein n=1 Tax=Calcarisporiella thermophila TaxID=911321 RepID=UPI0037438B29